MGELGPAPSPLAQNRFAHLRLPPNPGARRRGSPHEAIASAEQSPASAVEIILLVLVIVVIPVHVIVEI